VCARRTVIGPVIPPSCCACVARFLLRVPTPTPPACGWSSKRFTNSTGAHTIDLRDRFELDDATLPLADLLLTKLQIVQLNEKDVLDILALLADHELDPSENPEATRDGLTERVATGLKRPSAACRRIVIGEGS
jgi:hypothetical protein